MSTSQKNVQRVKLNPWRKKTEEPRPAAGELELACVYELGDGIYTATEILWFQRAADSDSLWSILYEQLPVDTAIGDIEEYASDLELLARAPVEGTRRVAAKQLFRELVRSRVGHHSPGDWLDGKLVSRTGYRDVQRAVGNEIRSNRQAASRGIESPIIQTARILGLGPETTGRSPVSWQARCPKVNHYLAISSATNTFGCGYCRRKGGPEELEAFVADREQWYEERMRQYRANTAKESG